MSRAWHRKNPALFGKEKVEVETAFPHLHFHIVNDVVFLRGSFPVAYEGRELDRFSIEIELAKDHPESLPIVREIAGRIPRSADRHVNATDGMACVLLPDECWRFWPKGSSLLAYMTGPLRNYFLGQIAVEMGQPWPFGEWRHGADGILEYYTELLKTNDVCVIANFLDCLRAVKTKGHWLCPCGSGKRLRDCHRDIVRDLREKIPCQVAEESLERLRVHLTGLRRKEKGSNLLRKQPEQPGSERNSC